MSSSVGGENANSEAMTTASLEQQLQEYRKKLSMYKQQDSHNNEGAAPAGGRTGSDSPPGRKVNSNASLVRTSSYSSRGSNAGHQNNVPTNHQNTVAASRAGGHAPPSPMGSPTRRQQQSRPSPGRIVQPPPAPHSSFSNSQTTPQQQPQQQQQQQDEQENSILFNYDDDNHEESVHEDEEELSWRSDPAKSLSDWTIQVSNRETRETQPYHVHRNVLAVGPRKSEYFVRFFLSHDRLHKSGRSTEIWLETVAAAAMPDLLDFMYSSEGKLNITTECAVGLRYLAQFFGMRPLHKKVMSFITRDLTMENLLMYYQHTVAVDDTKVSELASDHFAQNVMNVTVQNTDLLKAVDPLFFRRILCSAEIDTDEKRLHCSQLLAEYCVQHKGMLDDQDFTRLTDETCLPLVHFKAALTLMEMEADLVLLDHETGEMTSLQDRCLQNLSEHWEELSQMKPAELTRICRKLPSSLVTEIMVRSLGQAKKQIDQQQQQQQQPTGPNRLGASTPSAAAREYEAKVSQLKREHQKVLDDIKAEFETNLVKMREAVMEKDKFITEYWNELKRFERVPNAPEGKMVQSNPAATKLLRMPVIGNQPTDGLILSKPKGGGKYPLFMYKGGGHINGGNGEDARPS